MFRAAAVILGRLYLEENERLRAQARDANMGHHGRIVELDDGVAGPRGAPAGAGLEKGPHEKENDEQDEVRADPVECVSEPGRIHCSMSRGLAGDAQGGRT